MRITLTCPKCGNTWKSQSNSGRTRCGKCDERVYVPLNVRRAAGLAPATDVTKRSALSPSSNPVPTREPDYLDPGSSPSHKQSTSAPARSNGPSILDLAASAINAFAKTREQLSRMQPAERVVARQVSALPQPEPQHAPTTSRQSPPPNPSRFTVPLSPLEQEQLEALQRKEHK